MDEILGRMEGNERLLLEKNADELEKYFHKLEGLPESLEEINLKNPSKEDLIGLVVLYALKNPDIDITRNKLARFAGLDDQRKLNHLINKLYKEEIFPNYKGSTIGKLLKDSGFLDSNIHDVIGQFDIEIECKDLTKQIRIPKIDERIAWLSGMMSISAYREYFFKKSKKLYELSFRKDDRNLIDLEFLPTIEEYFNYFPPIKKSKRKRNIGLREFYQEGFEVCIGSRSIVSYFRNEIGINPKQEERGIPFEDEELRKLFIGGVVDRSSCLRYRKPNYPEITIRISYKYPKLANEIGEYLGRKVTNRKDGGYSIYFAFGKTIPEKIEEFGLRNPKWYANLSAQ